MKIRQANLSDLDTIMDIYEQARRFMRQQGNWDQWTNGYPQRELIEKDIRNNNCYVCILEEQLVGVFCYFQHMSPKLTMLTDLRLQKGKTQRTSCGKCSWTGLKVVHSSSNSSG